MAKKEIHRRDGPISLAAMRYENEYERLVAKLRDADYSDLHDQLLVFWTRPKDRRLPLVFMEWPLKKLLKLRFDEVQSTPGVGAKKVIGLISLLRRISENGDADVSAAVEQDSNHEPPSGSGTPEVFDVAGVSEAQWHEWCETVERLELMQVPIGRVARSLNEVPMVIWDTPLGNYKGHTLAEIRRMKTHGQKRVRIVVEAFWTVHRSLGSATPEQHVHLDVVPRFVRQLEFWIDNQLTVDAEPSRSEVQDGLIKPLLAQLETDVGDRIAQLVANRLGMNGEPMSVRSQAQEIGVTRARIYQWLEDCASAMHIRWPSGRWKMRALREKSDQYGESSYAREMLTTIGDIFFPES